MRPSLVDAIAKAIVRQISTGASPAGAALAASAYAPMRPSRFGRRRYNKRHPVPVAEDQVLLQLLASALTDRLSGQALANTELPLEAVEI